MNALNAIGKQISDLFQSMTPSARVMSALMLGVIVVSLGWITAGGASSTQYEYLFGGENFSDADLAVWEATFGEAQLREYERVGNRIKIPVGQKDLYLKALNSADVLPRDGGSYLDEALNKGSPFDPNSLIDKRFEVGHERELAANIRRMRGIDYASVSFDEERRGFGRETDRVCSIAVQGHGSAPVPPDQLRHISQMAATYFAGLPAENITVTDLGGLNSYRASGDPNAPEENPYLAAQRQWENLYEAKVGRVLSNYGDIQLAVNVQLDPTLTHQSEQLQFEPTAVSVQSTEASRTLENTRAAPAGPPGAATNGVANQKQSLSAAASSLSSKSKETEANERRLASHEATVTKTAGLVPKEIAVSIGIPDSYYRKVWNYRFVRDNPDKTEADAPAPTPAQLAELELNVEQAVRSAVEAIPVGVREGEDRKTHISVYTFTDLPLPELPQPSLASNALGWLSQSWSTLALIGLVLVSLGMMFSWVKSQGESDVERKFAEGFGLEVPEIIADELDIGDGGSDEEGGEKRRRPALEVTGEDMKEDLSTLIKENPDAAVNLIKTWIGEAA